MFGRLREFFGYPKKANVPCDPLIAAMARKDLALYKRIAFFPPTVAIDIWRREHPEDFAEFAGMEIGSCPAGLVWDPRQIRE